MNLSRLHALLVVGMLSLVSIADAYGMGIDLNIASMRIAKPILAENVLACKENVFCASDKKSLSCAVYFVIDAGSVASKKYYSGLIGAMFQHGVYRHAAINEIINGCFDISERNGERRNPIPIRRENGHPLFSFVKESAPHAFCANLLRVPVENWREFSLLPMATNGNNGISKRNNVYSRHVPDIFHFCGKDIWNPAGFINVGVWDVSLNNSYPGTLLRLERIHRLSTAGIGDVHLRLNSIGAEFDQHDGCECIDYKYKQRHRVDIYTSLTDTNAPKYPLWLLLIALGVVLAVGAAIVFTTQTGGWPKTCRAFWGCLATWCLSAALLGIGLGLFLLKTIMHN